MQQWVCSFGLQISNHLCNAELVAISVLPCIFVYSQKIDVLTCKTDDS
jgi:hypothetical protein